MGPSSCLSTRLLAVGLPQHPDQHRPERPVLLAVDQELGEGTVLWVAPKLADRLGTLDPKISRHARECEFASETDATVLKIVLKVKDGASGSYHWVECCS
jgi:hypothetical protein